jgi:hypothetical protein
MTFTSPPWETWGGDEYDLRGRRRVLHYRLESVSMAGLFVAWNFRPTEDAAPIRLETGYSSSRPFGTGASGSAGEASGGALASLGLDSAASELFDIGLAWLGISGRIGWQHFRAGRVEVEDRRTGMRTTQPLRLDRFTGRLSWNPKPFELFEEVDGEIRSWRPFGLTFYLETNDYVLPRILYRYRENGSPGPGEYRYTYIDETEPQSLRTRTYALGGTIIMQLLKVAGGGLTSHLELGGAFGGGSIRFDYDGDDRSESLYVGKVDAAWLTSIRFPGPGESLFEIGLQYNLELLNHFTGSSKGTFFEPSARDFFHGPRIELIARF